MISLEITRQLSWVPALDLKAIVFQTAKLSIAEACKGLWWKLYEGRSCFAIFCMDDYAKNSGPGEVWHLCSFYHESLGIWIKTTVNKSAISNHTALISGVHELHSLPKKVSGVKDHGKNYIMVRPPLVRHLWRNRLLPPIWKLRSRLLSTGSDEIYCTKDASSITIYLSALSRLHCCKLSWTDCK